MRTKSLILMLCVAGLVGSSQASAAVSSSPSADTPEADGPRTGMFTTESWLTPLILLPGVA